MLLPGVEKICSVVVHIPASQQNLMFGDVAWTILEEYYIKNSFECFTYIPWLQENLFLWHSALHFHIIYSADWTKADLINNFLCSCWPLNYTGVDNTVLKPNK